MFSYSDLYEVLRKEKYSEPLQLLSKQFVAEFADYLQDQKNSNTDGGDLFADSLAKSKKQFENSISIFKELILRRKKKLLSLVFVAAETGIMKRDYENMLPFEREVFDKLVKAFEEGDKSLSKLLSGKKDEELERLKLVIFKQEVEQFVDMNGGVIGPFKTGSLANLGKEIADIMVSSGKATYVDEN